MKLSTTDVCYRAIGRISLLGDLFRLFFAGSPERIPGNNDLDKTGILLKKAKPLTVHREDEIVFALYDSLAHSLWRAQELSLFTKYSDMFKRPLLDFGCGDGSFASVLSREIDYGTDVDREALNIAEQFGVYNKIINSSNSHIPIDNGSVFTVFSNSVLEHLTHLEDILNEINRILAKDGIFIFTATVAQFRGHLLKYYGEKASNRINIQYSHRNLLTVSDWKRLLEEHGFSIMLFRQYQPERFTFWYILLRIFGKKGLGYFIPDIHLQIWKYFKSRIIDLTRKSINDTEDGANIFVIAQKV